MQQPILPRLEELERAIKALLPVDGRPETFKADVEREDLGRIGGTLFSIEEGARILRDSLGVKLDVVSDAQVNRDDTD